MMQLMKWTTNAVSEESFSTHSQLELLVSIWRSLQSFSCLARARGGETGLLLGVSYCPPTTFDVVCSVLCERDEEEETKKNEILDYFRCNQDIISSSRLCCARSASHAHFLVPYILPLSPPYTHDRTDKRTTTTERYWWSCSLSLQPMNFKYCTHMMLQQRAWREVLHRSFYEKKRWLEVSARRRPLARGSEKNNFSFNYTPESF